MYMVQDRRRFLTTLSSAGVSGLIGGAKSVAQEAPPETTTIRLAKSPSLCIAPQYVAEDLLRAEGFTTVSYLMTDGGAGQSKMVARGEIDLTLHFSPLWLIPDRRRRKDHHYRRGARRLLRVVCDRSHPHHRRPQGQDGRGSSPRRRPPCVSVDHGRTCRARPRQRHQLGDQSDNSSEAAFRRGQDRRVPRLSAGPTGIARAQDRSRRRQ